MIHAVLALALTVGNPTTPPAATVVDTVRVVAHDSVDDVLEAVALKAGIVKQGDQMRL